jgi:hypothetical protein
LSREDGSDAAAPGLPADSIGFHPQGTVSRRVIQKPQGRGLQIFRKGRRVREDAVRKGEEEEGIGR